MEWISVEDRLPEINEDVFVYSKVIGRMISHIFAFGSLPSWNVHGYKGSYDPTHWQSLPEPPKGDNE